MTARVCAVHRVQISTSAVSTIRREAERSRDGNETGGILLGHLPGAGLATVRHAGDPGPVAVRQPSFFLRDLGHAQRLAARAFARDGSAWLGEWHTHPGTAAAPSDQDLDTYRRLLADPDLHFAVIVSIILAAPHDGWARPVAHTWACYPDRAERIPLIMERQLMMPRSTALVKDTP